MRGAFRWRVEGRGVQDPERVTSTELRRLDADHQARQPAGLRGGRDERDGRTAHVVAKEPPHAGIPCSRARASALWCGNSPTREADGVRRGTAGRAPRPLRRLLRRRPATSGGEADVASLRRGSPSARSSPPRRPARRLWASSSWTKSSGALTRTAAASVLLALERLKRSFGQIFIISHVAEVQITPSWTRSGCSGRRRGGAGAPSGASSRTP